MRIFPKGLLDVILVIHYYEAWLAFLAILIWHMYATVFSPEVYPMNPSWLTGNMPRLDVRGGAPGRNPLGQRSAPGGGARRLSRESGTTRAGTASRPSPAAFCPQWGLIPSDRP